jgi:hypothetical protein
MALANKAAKDPASRRVVPIVIDEERVRAPDTKMTGAEIRELVDPPIASDRDLWLDVDGDLDRKIGDDETVTLAPQMTFFSVPREINPGGSPR